jgi:hypothetical protein
MQSVFSVAGAEVDERHGGIAAAGKLKNGRIFRFLYMGPTVFFRLSEIFSNSLPVSHAKKMTQPNYRIHCKIPDVET